MTAAAAGVFELLTVCEVCLVLGVSVLGRQTTLRRPLTIYITLYRYNTHIPSTAAAPPSGPDDRLVSGAFVCHRKVRVWLFSVQTEEFKVNMSQPNRGRNLVCIEIKGEQKARKLKVRSKRRVRRRLCAAASRSSARRRAFRSVTRPTGFRGEEFPLL